MKRIILIRHGESTGNLDRLVYKSIADFAVPLTHRGLVQATMAGIALNQYMSQEGVSWRVWTSPYQRTRQTCQNVVSQLDPKYVMDVREHPLLIEQRFGCLDGVAGHDVGTLYPAIAEDYARHKESGSKFFASPWGGESRYDTAVRVHQAFGTFHRDCDFHGIENIVVVSHGTAIRCFIMMWMHLPYEWVDTEKNPENASIRLLDNTSGQWIDKGYIFNP